MARQVFEGIKVADFSWYAAGPMIATYLGILGATVIHIESGTRVDGLRTTPPFKDGKPGIDRSPSFAMFNPDKYGISLNLKHPKGVEIAKRIVSWADVVVENYVPGTMERLGLSYEELRRVKSDIIMVSTCNQGETGPCAKAPGFGTHLSSLCGFVNCSGWPDRGPVQVLNAYTDFISARFGTVALLAALDRRRRTGKGQYIDISQYETCVQYLAPCVLDFTINGRVAQRRGNRSLRAAPHGAYPCRGQDRWCTIAVFSDEDWTSMCEAMGNPQWTKDARFATLQGRKQNEDELDHLLGEWTLNFAPQEVMVRLQSAGVPAGVVQNLGEVLEDPQLKHSRVLWQLEHREIGRHTYGGPGFRLSKTPWQLRMPGPCLGEHNEYVYTKILGMSDEEFVELSAEGIFA